ncbi:MAG: hypothetical protein ACFFC7_02735 [Candidatus Hermodarchaeota archaeon]
MCCKNIKESDYEGFLAYISVILEDFARWGPKSLDLTDIKHSLTFMNYSTTEIDESIDSARLERIRREARRTADHSYKKQRANSFNFSQLINRKIFAAIIVFLAIITGALWLFELLPPPITIILSIAAILMTISLGILSYYDRFTESRE